MNELLSRLALGEVVSFPTDTVYALAVDFANVFAIEKLFLLKKRDKNKSFAVLVQNIEEVMCLADLSLKQKLFIEKIISGNITFVVPLKLKYHMHLGFKTIAIRVPKHNLSLSIISRFGGPIIATSANISGENCLNNANDIKNKFPDIYVLKDDNNSLSGTPSTVVSLLNDEFYIARTGSTDTNILHQIWKDIL